jgi:hypothetical protein
MAVVHTHSLTQRYRGDWVGRAQLVHNLAVMKVLKASGGPGRAVAPGLGSAPGWLLIGTFNSHLLCEKGVLSCFLAAIRE